MRMLRIYCDTLVATVTDGAIFLFLIVAPLIYAFFYPQAYRLEVARHVPVAIIDADESALARRIERDTAASPELALSAVVATPAAADRLLAAGTVSGALMIPRGLERDVLRHRQAHLVIFGNGAYPLLNSTTTSAFAAIVRSIDAGIDIRVREVRGATSREAAAERAPLTLSVLRLFNPTSGYAKAVIPAVGVLIVHQTILLGVGVAMATRRERQPRGRYRLSRFLPETMAFATFGFATILFYEGFELTVWDLPRSGDALTVSGFAALFALATTLFAMALGLLVDSRERVAQVVIPFSIPLLFMAGYLWPSAALPDVLRVLRWLVPSTAGILGLTQIAQMGASWNDVGPEVLDLSLLALGWGSVALLMLRRRSAPRASRPPAQARPDRIAHAE